MTSSDDTLAAVTEGRLAGDEAAHSNGERLVDPGYTEALLDSVEKRFGHASVRHLVGYLAATTAAETGLWFLPLVARVGYQDWNLVNGLLTGVQRFLGEGAGVVAEEDRRAVMGLLERTVELGPDDSVDTARSSRRERAGPRRDTGGFRRG